MEPHHEKKLFYLDARILEIERQPYFYSTVQCNSPLPKPKTKTILMVIDKSGSMEGENIDQSKKVLILLLNFFRTSLPDASLNLITFDVKSVLYPDLNMIPLKDAEKIINRIEANSSTFFSGVFRTMQDFVKSKNLIEDLSIIFMTDGEIVIKEEKIDNFKKLNESIENLNQTLTDHTKECDIHTIGLGKEHDPFLLEKLLTLRPLHSTYLFIIDETGIEPSFKAVKDMIYQNNIKGIINLVDAKGKKNKKFNLAIKEIEMDIEEQNEKREWEIFHKLDYDISEIQMESCSLTICVSNGQFQETYPLLEIIKNVESLEEEFKFNLIKIRNEMSIILSNLKHQSKNNDFNIIEMDQFTQTKNEAFKAYHQIFMKIFKIKNSEMKKKLFSFCEELSPLMNVVEELLSSAYIAKIKNDVLAKAVQISHKNIKKKRYIKELKGRITDTVKLYNGQDEEILKFSQKFLLEKETLYKRNFNLTKDFSCFLTCYDFIEAICEQDCLCITFDISRSESAIMEPSTIKINAIYPTIISAQSFLNAIKYSLNLNFNENSINKEHIIKGVAQESINAAMPIFLCSEHWTIARLLIDRILAWIVTLDPLGYHIKQKMTFPFLLLEFNIVDCFKKGSSNFTMKYFRLITETCLNLMIEEENNKKSPFKATLLRHWNNYIEDGNERLPENIRKCSLFFLKSFCAIVLGWIKPEKKEIEEIFYFLLEEELRRSQIKEFHSFGEYDNINILNKTNEIKDELLNKYCKKYHELFLKNCTVFVLIKHLIYKYKSSLDDLDFKDLKDISSENFLLNELGFEDKTQFYGLFFQNQLHSVNEARKKAFINKTYIDCRKNWKEVFALHSENIKLAQEKRLNLKEQKIEDIDTSKLRKKFRNVEVIIMLKQYKETENLDEAEDLLNKCLKIKPGRVLDYYINVFGFYEFEKIPLLYPKLILMRDKHKRFRKTITKKFNYSLCFSNLLSHLELEDVFGEENLPWYKPNKK